MPKLTDDLAVAVGILPVFLFCSAPSIADADISTGLARCASQDVASDRLDCYDKLSGRLAITSPSGSKPAKNDAPVPTSPPDELGAGALRTKDTSRANETAVAARVIRCVKDRQRDYIFYLDGGQVWKQVSDKKLSYKDCEFNVEIDKDAFGYTMRIEGESAKIRVKRIR